ncbi:hypothetical protein BC826DRAFT_1107552 [Russula brevipes]|nr:hypothetical protein BC826DRAFT_1107552 [Russula brevipes]
MSALHSCHWGGCPFTTSLHDDFVRHVISTHVDEAKPVKRRDIGLIRAEQAASSHSGIATTSQPEAPQPVSQPLESTVDPRLSSPPLLSPDRQQVFEANQSVPSEPENTQRGSHVLSFTSGSTSIPPVSQRKHPTTAPSSLLAEVQLPFS